MRITIDVPEADIRALAVLATARAVSRSALIREAIGAFLQPTTAANEAFGLWRGKSRDGIAYQRDARSEWPG